MTELEQERSDLSEIIAGSLKCADDTQLLSALQQTCTAILALQPSIFRGLSFSHLKSENADVKLQQIYIKCRQSSHACSERQLIVSSFKSAIIARTQKNLPWSIVAIKEFGAGINTFCLNSSDIDLSVDVDPSDISNLIPLRYILSILSKRGPLRIGDSSIKPKLTLKSKATPPILAITLSYGGHERRIDITINNEVPLINSKFLASIGKKFDPDVHTCCLLVKLWAKCNGISNASKGYISSFFWIIMCIFYLQHRTPAYLINLFNPPKVFLEKFSDMFVKQKNRDNFLVHYLPKDTSIPLTFNTIHSILQPNAPLPIKESAVDLFAGFFKFFAVDFNYTEHVVSIRSTSPHFPKSEKMKEKGKNCIIIVDPFRKDVIHPATHSKGGKILKKIRQAYTVTISDYDWIQKLLPKHEEVIG